MICIENGYVSLTRDGRNKLEISISIRDGDCVLLVGPNGSGKTTILDIISGARKLDVGKFTLDNASYPIAYAVQEANSGVLPWITILGNILLPAKISGSVSQQLMHKVKALLERFGLFTRRNEYPYNLSGGEKQIVNLIRTICTPSTLFLFDESFSRLHQNAKELAKKAVVDSVSENTAIFVTHDIADMNLPYNRFFLINNHKVHEVSLTEAERELSNVL